MLIELRRQSCSARHRMYPCSLSVLGREKTRASKCASEASTRAMRAASVCGSKVCASMCLLKRAEAYPAVTDTTFCTRPLKGSSCTPCAAAGGHTSEISSDSVYAVTAPKRSSKSVAVATIAAFMRVS